MQTQNSGASFHLAFRELVTDLKTVSFITELNKAG
jgi:hypothetical protein